MTSPTLESAPVDTHRADAALAAAYFASLVPSASAVCALNDHVLIANARAAKCLLAADQAALWQRLRLEVPSNEPFAAQLEVRGKTVALLCTPVVVDGSLAGILIDFDAENADSSHASADLKALVPGESVSAELARAEISRELRSTAGTLISGPAGTGKSSVARYLLAAGFPGNEFVIVDAAHHSFSALEDAVGSGNAIVLLHVDELSADESDRVAEALGARIFEVPVIATSAHSAASGALAELLLGRIHLPALSERMEDLPDIARHILSAVPGRDYRLSPAARKLLMSHHWSGNVAELERTLRAATLASPSSVISPYSLRLMHDSGSQPTGYLRTDERQSILLALSRANGNKQVAAELLGIARSTLYKKLEAFGDDLPVEFRGKSRSAA